MFKEIEPYSWLDKPMRSLKKCAKGYAKHDIKIRLKMYRISRPPATVETVEIRIIFRDENFFLGGRTYWDISLYMQAVFLIYKEAVKHGFSTVQYENKMYDADSIKHLILTESSSKGFDRI